MLEWDASLIQSVVNAALGYFMIGFTLGLIVRLVLSSRDR